MEILHTPLQAARLLGLYHRDSEDPSVEAIRSRVHRKTLRCVKLGSSIRIPQSAIDEALKPSAPPRRRPGRPRKTLNPA